MDDRITKLNPQNGALVQYLMPIETNLRRIAIDNYGSKPTLWVGAQHQGTVLHIEPLE
jgi:hypothetical protein